MGYEGDPYRDEEGEPIMDYEDFQSDHEGQGAANEPLLFDNLDDDDDDDAWGRRGDRSPTPVYDESDMKSKPRKRLVKKGAAGETTPDFNAHGLNDDLDIGDDDAGGYPREVSDVGGPSSSVGEKLRKFVKDSAGKRKEKKIKGERRNKGDKGGSKFNMRKNSGYSGKRSREHDGDAEVKEMWETIAGGDSEDDREGPRTVDDDNFIDDSGLDPNDVYGSGEPNSPGDAPQAEEGEEGEEDEEINELFKVNKKKKKNEKSAAEIALLVENVMAELEVVAEEDAELNRQSKPAINKLKKLPLLTEVLSKRQLQQEFLDHGVLTLLKNWLEPLPDGSLPNSTIREAILRILTDYPIDLEQYDRREQLKKSGLGKVIMFLSKSDEETTSNRKLAKDLVDKWSRPIFNKSTRFEDMRNFEDERVPFRRPTVKKPMNKATGIESRDDDLDLAGFSQARKSGQASRQQTTRPEAMAMDFVVRPQSKIDPDEVRARAKQVVQDQRRIKMNKKLQQLKAPKKKKLQASRISVEGRGMVKYL